MRLVEAARPALTRHACFRANEKHFSRDARSARHNCRLPGCLRRSLALDLCADRCSAPARSLNRGGATAECRQEKDGANGRKKYCSHVVPLVTHSSERKPSVGVLCLAKPDVGWQLHLASFFSSSFPFSSLVLDLVVVRGQGRRTRTITIQSAFWRSLRKQIVRPAHGDSLCHARSPGFLRPKKSALGPASH